MARAVWNGVVTFGMVSIPVGLYPATSEKDVRFHQLHKTCGSRIKLKKWCPVDDVALEPEDIVRGFEVSKGQYVTVTDADLDKLPVSSKHTIEITSFVDEDDVDPLYYDASYYLEPSEAGVKPFALFFKALSSKNVSAVGKVALRNKENLCLLRPGNGTVVLETLYYPDEIRVPAASGFDKREVDKKQLALAENLIDLMTARFDPEEHRDEYREALLAMIEAKREGGEVAEAPEAPSGTKVYDLMDALRASLESAKGAGAAKPKAKKRRTG
ncbi:MAG: Ku protein [Armatimonadetes bacterium]|nr:Ku protein [Armatimonadota bacterium]